MEHSCICNIYLCKKKTGEVLIIWQAPLKKKNPPCQNCATERALGVYNDSTNPIQLWESDLNTHSTLHATEFVNKVISNNSKVKL